MYVIELASQPKKFLKSLSFSDQKRIIDKLKALSEDPLPKGVIPISGCREKAYRVRVGNYRILYTILKNETLVLISAIDKRNRVYKR